MASKRKSTPIQEDLGKGYTTREEAARIRRQTESKAAKKARLQVAKEGSSMSREDMSKGPIGLLNLFVKGVDAITGYKGRKAASSAEKS